MSRGLSAQQRQVLALLDASTWPLDVTEELLPELGLEPTDSTRRSLLRSMRNLRERGLVTLERVPSERGGWPRYRVSSDVEKDETGFRQMARTLWFSYLRDWDETWLSRMTPAQARRQLKKVQEIDAGVMEFQRALEDKLEAERLASTEARDH